MLQVQVLPSLSLHLEYSPKHQWVQSKGGFYLMNDSQNLEQIQDQNTVQSQNVDQGSVEGLNQAQNQDQNIDYEKAYRNLEKEFTRKSQKLAQLEAWEKFQEKTGITAEQALAQFEKYQQQQQQYPSGVAPNHNQYPDPYAQPYYEDPRIAHLEQQIQEMRQAQQIERLRKRFPQFDEMYPDVLNLAQAEGLDIETAFGRLMVERWDEVKERTEKQIVDQIRQKGLKSVESSTDSNENDDETAGLTQQELEAARLMGISPKDYAEMKNVRSLVD